MKQGGKHWCCDMFSFFKALKKTGTGGARYASTVNGFLFLPPNLPHLVELRRPLGEIIINVFKKNSQLFGRDLDVVVAEY